MPDTAPDLLYRSFVAQDPAAAIHVIEKARTSASSGDLFDTVFAPALALLGSAWASAEIDETAFVQAAVVAEQISSFVIPSVAAPDTGVTVIVGCARHDRHSMMKNIVGAALKDVGNRVIDLGVDVRPAEFVEKADETGARIVLVFAEIVQSARGVVDVRESLAAGGHGEVVLLVCGGPFVAEPGIARAVGANGVVRGAESACRVVARAAAERFGEGAAS